MFCKHCGKEIQQGAAFCSHCGGMTENRVQSADPFDTPPASYNSAPSSPAPKPTTAPVPQNNTLSTVGFVLSFLISLAGLICSIMGLKKADECGGTGKGLAIAGIVISVLNMVFSFIINVIIMPQLIDMSQFIGMWTAIFEGAFEGAYNGIAFIL